MFGGDMANIFGAVCWQFLVQKVKIINANCDLWKPKCIFESLARMSGEEKSAGLFDAGDEIEAVR